MTPTALLTRMLARLAAAMEADWCGAEDAYADGRRDEALDHFRWLGDEMAKLSKGEA